MRRYPTRINFVNKPSVATPLGALNLNKIDKATYDIDIALDNVENNLGSVIADQISDAEDIIIADLTAGANAAANVVEGVLDGVNHIIDDNGTYYQLGSADGELYLEEIEPDPSPPVSETILDDIDQLQTDVSDLQTDKVDKTSIMDVQVDDATKVPSSALAYDMGQSIQDNADDIQTLNDNLVKVAVLSQQVWCITDVDTVAEFNLSAYSNIIATFAQIVGVSTLNDTRLTRVYGFNNKWDIVSKTSQDVYVQCIVLYKLAI